MQDVKENHNDHVKSIFTLPFDNGN